MKRNEDFRNALGQPDEYFQQSVIDTLDQLNKQAERESRPQRRYTTRIVATFAALVMLVAGAVLARRFVPGISPDGQIDAINPTPVVAAQVTGSSSVVETDNATLIFQDATIDGDNIRFTVEIQPKREKCLITSADHLLSSPSESVTDFYGIQPEKPEDSMYSWVIAQGYQEALAVELNTPWDGTDGPFYGSYKQEKCLLRDDGSAVMTIVGPVAENNMYDLEWHIIPWNMEDHGDSFHPDQHEHGFIQLTVTTADQSLKVNTIPEKAASVEVPEAQATESIPSIPPVSEYSAKAWALTGEGYADLLENMNDRIGQVYVVKGTVQEVVSEDPLSVIINTGEDGASQPVIVESPEYHNFAWEPGADYRIYADVSSVRDDIPVLIARYSYTSLADKPVESDLATLKVREAKTDGYGTYLQVEVQPKEEKTLVVPGDLDIMNDSVLKLGIDEQKSIYKWAADNHHQLLIVDFCSPVNPTVSDTDTESGFYPNWKKTSFIEENGSTVIKVANYAVPGIIQYSLCFNLSSVDQDSSGNLSYNLLETGVLSATVSETEAPKVVAEYKPVSSSSAGFPTPDATLTLLQSSCSDYCELRSSDTEHMPPDSFMLSNDFFADEKLVEWVDWGSNDVNFAVVPFSLSFEEDNTFVLWCSWSFPQEIPDKFRLSETSGYYSGLYVKVQ